MNYYITEAVREGIQAKYHESMPETYPDTILSSDCTIQDLAELLVTKVKEELAEGESAFGTNWQSEDTDPLLLATSDYFLTGEERIQKALMNNKKSGL